MKKIFVRCYRLIMRLFPVTKIIVFESHPTYSDNTKIVYDYVVNQERYKNYKLYWINNLSLQNEQQFKNLKLINFNNANKLRKTINFLKMSYYISRCSIYVFSHNNYSGLKPKATQLFINLTHGISLKNTRGFYPKSNLMSVIAVTSPFTKQLRLYSFPGGEDKIKITGFPRNDLLFRKFLNLKSKFNIDNNHNIVMWLPTFRRQQGTGRNDTKTTNKFDLPLIESEKDLQIINDVLVKNNKTLLIKPHPAQDLKYFCFDDFTNIKVINNEHLLQKNIHLYELLSIADSLITDYSSVFIDYLLRDKPIAFTIDDLDKYDYHKGFSVNNPLDYMPGAKCEILDDILDFLENPDNKKYALERKNMINLFHTYRDDKSTQRIIEYMDEHLSII